MHLRSPALFHTLSTLATHTGSPSTVSWRGVVYYTYAKQTPKTYVFWPTSKLRRGKVLQCRREGNFQFLIKDYEANFFSVIIELHGWIVHHKTINLGEQRKYATQYNQRDFKLHLILSVLRIHSTWSYMLYISVSQPCSQRQTPTVHTESGVFD